MWFDTHCHINSARFDDDRADILSRARDTGLTGMINIGCEIPSWEPSLAVALEEPDIFCSLGLHPHEARHWNDEVQAQLQTLLTSSPKIVAIGEMGLDYYYNHSPAETQVKVFHTQLDMAEALNLPAVFHIRDAHEQAAAILAEHPKVKGIVHCFTGGPADAERYLAQGHAISFSGIVTFKKATELQDAARMVPDEAILVETDAPYLAPVPRRGKRNEPAYVAHTGAFVAKLRGCSEADFAALTGANTRRRFRFPEDQQ